MENSRQKLAPSLHKPGLMVRVVAIVAVLGLGACGQGVEETGAAPAQNAQTSQALEAPVPEARVETSATPRTSASLDAGSIALPQDPVPLFDGRLTFVAPMLGVTQGAPPAPRTPPAH